MISLRWHPNFFLAEDAVPFLLESSVAKRLHNRLRHDLQNFVIKKKGNSF